MALTLAEAKSVRDDLGRAIPRHKAHCPQCGSTVRGRGRPAPCAEGAMLAALHKDAVQQIKTWFTSTPGRGTLF